MKYKKIIYIFTLILLCSCVYGFAEFEDITYMHLNMQDNFTDKYNNVTCGFDLGGTASIVSAGKWGNGGRWDGDNNVDILNCTIGTLTEGTINYWIKRTNGVNCQAMNTENGLFYHQDNYQAGGEGYERWGDTNNALGSSTPAGEWIMITFTAKAGENPKLYRNGTLLYTDTSSTRGFETYNLHLAKTLLGDLDEVTVFTEALNQTKVTELLTCFNNQSCWGANATPPAPPVVSNESIESTIVQKQVGATLLLGPTPSTILSGSFNITKNNTPLYGAYSLEVTSSGTNELYCEFQLDGTSVANSTRSNVAGVTGSMFFSSPLINLTNGTHTAELICNRQSGAGQILISGTVGIGHLLINEQEEFINNNEVDFNVAVTSGTSFTQLAELNFTMNNDSNGEKIHALVIEGGIEYLNNHGSDEVLAGYININGTTNCSIYPRYVESGNTGSVSWDCILENVTANETYNLKFYGNGTNANYNAQIIVKNFFMDEQEIVGGTGILKGSWFNGSNDVLLINVTGGNLNHAVANAFIKLSHSIISDADTTAYMYITIRNGDTFYSKNFTRDFETGKAGVLIGHDSFENLPLDNYTIQLYGNCGGANCQIVGGSSLGYVTDDTTFIFNEVNITAYNAFNGSSIRVFNVTSGDITVSTTTGRISFSTTDPIINFNVRSKNYFENIILNHNATLDFNASMNQSRINVTLVKVFSEEIIQNFTITNGFYTQSTTKSYMIVPFNIGENTFIPISDGYFNSTNIYNSSALKEDSAQFDMFDANFKIRAFNAVDNSSITTFNVNITDVLSGESIFNSTSTSSLNFTLEKARQYSLEIASNGFSTSTELYFINESFQEVNFYLYTFNSVRVNIYYFSNLTLIERNISVTTIAENINFSLENVTNTGQIYIDFLTPESYELRFQGLNLNPISKFVSVINDSTRELNVYMTENSTTEIQQISVIDGSSQPVEDAVVWLQQEKITNGTIEWLTIQEAAKTNTEGLTSVFVERDVTIFYRFAVIIDGIAVPILPNKNLFSTKTNFIPGITETIVLEVQLEEGGTDLIDDRLSVQGNVTVVGNTFVYKFIDGRNSIVGGTLRVSARYLEDNLTYTLVSEQQVLGSFGEISYVVPQINNTIWVAEGIINYAGSEEIIDTAVIEFPLTFIIDRATGLLLLDILFISILFITVALGPLWSSIAAIIALALGTIFVFASIPTTIINSLAALGIILFFNFRKKRNA